MATSPGPHHPLAAPGLASFLAGSRTILVGQLDRRGEVMLGNPALGRWVGGGARGHLRTALTPRGFGRWERSIQELVPGRERVLTLALHGPEAGVTRYRCLLSAGEDDSVWLLGEPRSPVAAARDPVVEALRAELEQTRRQAALAASIDRLTGIANRSMGELWLETEAAEAGRRALPLACLMVDLDHFKSTNDTYGHPAGDRALKEAARALAGGLRATDRLARHGGDEFLILLPATRGDEAMIVAERLRRLLATGHVDPGQHPLTASFGVAERREGEDGPALLARADAALLRAKRAGRDRVERDP